MLLYVETTTNQISASTPTYSIDFEPTIDISNTNCLLKVEQFFLASGTNPRTSALADIYTVVRCNLTQPNSQAFKDTESVGNNSVIFIRNIQSAWSAPSIPVYVAGGPQKLTFTFNIASTTAVSMGMLISLVAV